MQLSRLGKGLVVPSIAISVYEIYTAENKVSESGRKIAINAAGGAMVGLMCGPDASVCVLIGGFVSGALAVWEMGSVWN
ncbi:hypothetical protein ACEV60_12310 [Enterobacter ludwigii]|nr:MULTISPECIES: hypothetical protein [Enterobacter]EKS6745035.1 hypothetical protein [Enterobacter ludwigii]ELP5689261.1 hypothetical protein [Enterobacter ludwigii]MDR6368493.1 hypothetical protein [Enterobacter sp. SORGH_AS_0287]MED7686546.1 hypothetical protein [Enterobacter ludwigii]HDR2486131.1 hypothetical protein [Enterobacter ludwigii]